MQRWFKWCMIMMIIVYPYSNTSRWVFEKVPLRHNSEETIRQIVVKVWLLNSWAHSFAAADMIWNAMIYTLYTQPHAHMHIQHVLNLWLKFISMSMPLSLFISLWVCLHRSLSRALSCSLSLFTHTLSISHLSRSHCVAYLRVSLTSRFLFFPRSFFTIFLSVLPRS